jgi:hypothetical protein
MERRKRSDSFLGWRRPVVEIEGRGEEKKERKGKQVVCVHWPPLFTE